MIEHITKTIYLDFLCCGKNTWLKLYKPELISMFELSVFDRSLLAKGNLVERHARLLFPSGVLVQGTDGVKTTAQLMEQKTPVIFQGAFIYDKFLARTDVLEFDQENDCWNLYEIKGTNSLDENAVAIDHIEDATFQAIILKSLGIKLGKIKIIHLNKEYVRGDELSIPELFAMDDITTEVSSREENTKLRMQKAVDCLFQEDEKALDCQCIYSGRNSHCTTFRYSYPTLPEYSIHDLARISAKKLKSLVDSEIFNISDIPDDFELTPIQKNQANAHKTQRPLVDLAGIKTDLDGLKFPLYFLDYETYPPAIPLFKGFKPYQHVPFQFSVDRLDTPGGKPVHFEYLHVEKTDPSPYVIQKLLEVIGTEGSILVWHKSFEMGKNTQLAERHPEFKAQLDAINERVYDLKDIFQKQYYVHHGFGGKTSIKKILPVMVPALTYKELEIKEGGSAMEAWYEMIYGSGTQAEKDKVAADLLTYCGLDTHAMYAIWNELITMQSKHLDPVVINQ